MQKVKKHAFRSSLVCLLQKFLSFHFARPLLKVSYQRFTLMKKTIFEFVRNQIRVARPQKIKKAKFGRKLFQKKAKGSNEKKGHKKVKFL